MSKLISKLPKRIRDRALECQRMDNTNIGDKETDILEKAFDWRKTKEGYSVWYYVYQCFYSEFYTFHNIKPHGGKRPNAGRPLKYGEPVVDATYYVPKSKKPTIDKLVKTQLKQWECKKEINL